MKISVRSQRRCVRTHRRIRWASYFDVRTLIIARSNTHPRRHSRQGLGCTVELPKNGGTSGQRKFYPMSWPNCSKEKWPLSAVNAMRE